MVPIPVFLLLVMVCVCVDGTGIAIFAGCGESDFGIVAELADDG